MDLAQPTHNADALVLSVLQRCCVDGKVGFLAPGVVHCNVDLDSIDDKKDAEKKRDTFQRCMADAEELKASSRHRPPRDDSSGYIPIRPVMNPHGFIEPVMITGSDGVIHESYSDDGLYIGEKSAAPSMQTLRFKD